MLSRRDVLKATALVSMSQFVPSMLVRAACAATAGHDSRCLVVIQLDGGNDGINTVVPYADDAYGRNRDKLRLDEKSLHKLDAHSALHASMQPAKALFDEGRLAIVQGVGYPNPDRSHFRSMRIWHTARLDEGRDDGYGWLGRTLDSGIARQAGGDAGAVYVGDQETPAALWGRRSETTALSRATDLKLEMAIAAGQPATPTVATAESLEQFVSRQVLSAYAAADEFNQRQSQADVAKAQYPNSDLASRLSLVSQLLKSGARSRIFYTTQTGYDTHSAQLFTHAQLLREFAAALKAFLDDLRAAGLDDRVTVLAFSEFGRRVKENDSLGTDHGTAGPVFLAGGAIQGGLVGNPPDLSDLESGDIKGQFDFRQVYATVLDGWLGVSSQEILGTAFPVLPLFV